MVRAAFFDLDKTVLDTSSNVALSGPFIEAGLMNRRTAITSFLVQLPYLLSGADEVLASKAATDEDGCFTGEVTHFNQAQGKADACEALARARGWDLSECSAYSDSVSDAPLLRLVGHPYAVNPDRALREMAEREGWPTLTFLSTVRVLPRRVPTPAKVAVPFMAGVAVGAAACALLRR